MSTVIAWILFYWFACAIGMIMFRVCRMAYEGRNRQPGKHKSPVYAIIAAPLAFPCLIGLCLYFIFINKRDVLEYIKRIIDNIEE